MTEYYLSGAARDRLTLSLGVIADFADRLNQTLVVSADTPAEFDPEAFLARLENIELESAFLREYVTERVVGVNPLPRFEHDSPFEETPFIKYSKNGTSTSTDGTYYVEPETSEDEDLEV